MRIQTTLALALLAIVTAAQNTTTPLNTPLNFNCSTLQPLSSSQVNTTTPSSSPIRVSKAVICPSDASPNDARCDIVASGRVSINSTVNATDISDPLLLYSTLRRTLEAQGASSTELNRFTMRIDDMSFNGTGKRFRVEAGEASYIGFFPEMHCYEGQVKTLSTCEQFDSGISNVRENFEDRGLSVCIPQEDRKTTKSRHSAKPRHLRAVGRVELVVVSEEEARREGMDRNPAVYTGSNPDDDDELSNHTITREPQGNIAGAERLGGGLMGSLVLAVGVVVVMGLV